MGYLLPAEYEAYSLEAETADEWVTMASALMEAHCRRPTLLAAQYTERMRLTAGSQTGRLSYGPLLPGALISARVRYGRGRHGDMTEASLAGMEIATAFGLPGSWSELDVTYLCSQPAGVGLQRSRGDVYGGIRDRSRTCEGGLRTGRKECAGYSGIEREAEPPGHDADGVLRQHADR